MGVLGVDAATDTGLAPRRAKYINVTLALSTTQFLSQETEYIPWEAALNNLHYFQLMFDRTEVFGPMTVSSATTQPRPRGRSLPLGRAPCRGNRGEGLGLHPEPGRGVLPVPPGADRPPAPQKYIQNQVTPLFDYYENITDNWNTLPSGLMDQ